MSDLVQRLRAEIEWLIADGSDTYASLIGEAADRIEELEKFILEQAGKILDLEAYVEDGVLPEDLIEKSVGNT